MKVRINFESNDIEECIDFRNQLVDLIEKIDNEVLHYDTDKEDYEDDIESDPDEDECKIANEDTKKFLEDIDVGRIAEFLKLSLKLKNEDGEYIRYDNEFTKELFILGISSYEDVDAFVSVFQNLISRNKKNNKLKTFYEKLIKAGFTEEFAVHTVDTFGEKLDTIDIPNDSDMVSFTKLLEDLGIKENKERKEKENKEKELKEYKKSKIASVIHEYGSDCARAVNEYLKNNKSESKEDIDHAIDTVLRFLGVLKTTDDTASEEVCKDSEKNKIDIEFDDHKKSSLKKKMNKK